MQEARLDPIPNIQQPPHPLDNPQERVGFKVVGPLRPRAVEGINWNNVLDAVLFVTLLVLGCLLLYYREELKLGVFGEIFINAGITPLILTTWALLLGSSMFRRQNMLKALSAAICFSLGYSVVRWEAGADEYMELAEIVGLFAPAFLELGVIFFISKFFFMAEDAELMAERLEGELEEARRSPGVGLAMSYFYNFLVPTCANLDEGVLGTQLAVQSVSEPYRLAAGASLFVFVPRSLNDVDLKAQLRDMQASP